jgi:hypothetical protein
LRTSEQLTSYKKNIDEWKKAILNVLSQTNIKHKSKSESVQQEKRFWNKKEGAVKNIEAEIQKAGVSKLKQSAQITL